MATSPFFVTAQVALVAVSAALLKVDWTDKSKQYMPPPPKTAAKVPLISLASRTGAPAYAPPAVPAPGSTLAKVKDQPPARGDHGISPSFGTESTLSGPPETTPFVDDVLGVPATSIAAYDITADTASNFNVNSGTVTFSGRVVMKSKRFDLTSSRLVIYMDKSNNTVKKLMATGDVKVKINAAEGTEDHKASAYEATFDPKDSSIALSGWPQIIGNGREHRAADKDTRMVMFTDNPRLVTQGRAATKIIGTDNVDPKKPKFPIALPVK
jgi:lipopolysaccharide transport protein LptA